MNNTIDFTEVRARLRVLVRDHSNYKRWSVRFGNALKVKANGEDQKRPTEYNVTEEYRNQVTSWMDQCNEIKSKVEKEINKLVHKLPIWKEWAVNQVGVGEITIAYLEAYVDLDHATANGMVVISKVWRFCGYGDPNDRKGERGKKRNYVETLKTQLHIFATNGVERNRTRYPSKYGEIYDGTKLRLQNTDRMVEHTKKGEKPTEVPWSEVSDGHRRDAAFRKVIKEFLKDYVMVRGSLEGRMIRPAYAEEYLGKVHAG